MATFCTTTDRSSRPRRCYLVARRTDRAERQVMSIDPASASMTAFVRDFADNAARCLIAAPHQAPREVWLFPMYVGVNECTSRTATSFGERHV